MSDDAMDIVAATRAYEGWLGEQIELVAADLGRKHEKMDKDAFTFLRATHYRWLQRVLEVAPELDGPGVAGVGDLHVENFGTWRDAEARLVWGINDFDESEQLPYALDLARLATSAVLAIEDADVDISPQDAHEAILAAYTDALGHGGEPFVLDGHHDRLAELVDDALPDADEWWDEQRDLDATGDAPAEALAALAAVAPAADWGYELRRRVAGVGSLGHRRLVALGLSDGAPAARELKQLSPPAGQWLGRAPSAGIVEADAVRSPDPLRAVRAGWQARRLAPDNVKLDLSKLKTRGRERHLFGWMGAETANIHLGSSAAVPAVQADLADRDPSWLNEAATRLADATREDWRRWRERDD